MKILQVAAPTTAGGLERVLENLAVGLQRRGHDVTVAALLFHGDEEHPVVRLLRGQGVRVVPVCLAPREYLRERRQLARLSDELKPDIVHTHGYRVDLLDRGVFARRGIRTVTTVHGASKAGGLKGAFFEWLQRRNYARFDAVVAVSQALYDETIRDGVEPGHLHLIRNAWGGLHEPLDAGEARRRLDLDAHRPVLGWVGRFMKVKGADVFLEAVARLPRPHPQVAMIGYGPEASNLERDVARLGLQDTVRFYGDVTQAGPLFGAFDAYVLSSRSEGLPIVVLEAMAAGVPIVATRVGGIGDVLGNGEALLVPPDDPGALADAMRNCLADRETAAARARKATHRLESEFGLEPWLDRHEDMYLRLTSSRSDGR